MSKCGKCGEDITWVPARSGKNHPLNHNPVIGWIFGIDGKWRTENVHTSHYETCTGEDKYKTEERE